MKHLFLITMTLFFSVSGLAGEEHGDTPDPRFGAGKAIEAFDKEQGFKLSEKAAKNLGVSFDSLKGQGSWKVPKSSLVQLKQSFGVYRKYDGWISFVLVKVQKEEGLTVTISSVDLEPGDEIAITGAAFLRMTDSDLNAGTVDNCSH